MGTYDRYRRAWAARLAARDADARARAERARETAARLARILADEFGADRVVLIGSIARGDAGPRSDLDLLARGIPPERYFRASARLAREAGELEVDLVPWETASPELLADAERDGIDLTTAGPLVPRRPAG